jgi:hypothetical protein
MKYEKQHKVERSVIDDGIITDEDVFRILARQLIRNVPFSDLAELFLFSKIDPLSTGHIFYDSNDLSPLDTDIIYTAKLFIP